MLTEVWLNGKAYQIDEDEYIARCTNCGLDYINPRLVYTPGLAAYNQEEELAYFRSTYEERLRAYRSILDRLSSWSSQVPSSLLDIGCGDGALLEAALDAGMERILGLEISPILVELVSDHLGAEKVTGAPIETLPGGSFEVVTIINVLEHLHEPATMLEEAARVLADRGIILVHVPNIGGLPARLAGPRWSQIEPYAHFSYFKPSTLAGLLERTGFTPIGRFHLPTGPGARSIVQNGLARIGLYIDNGLGMVAMRKDS